MKGSRQGRVCCGGCARKRAAPCFCCFGTSGGCNETPASCRKLTIFWTAADVEARSPKFSGSPLPSATSQFFLVSDLTHSSHTHQRATQTESRASKKCIALCAFGTVSPVGETNKWLYTGIFDPVVGLFFNSSAQHELALKHLFEYLTPFFC
jgi:hypothetical protein